jgi:hypothetical protein
MENIPNGTWVRIIKPDDSDKNWSSNGTRWKDMIWWTDRMDKYNNSVFQVMRSFQNMTYDLVEDDENWSWHKDWLIPVEVDQDGYPIPNDNEKRNNCYWCGEKTKTKIIRFKYDTDKMYTYCPKCLR